MYIGVTGLVCNVARNSNIEAALREVPEARQRLVRIVVFAAPLGAAADSIRC